MKSIIAAVYQPEARDETPSSRLDRLETRLREAGSGAYDLLLCPELFLSGYDVGEDIHEFAETNTGPSLTRIPHMATRYKTALAVGYPERNDQALYNSVCVVGKSGERLLDYRKRVLPPGFEGQIFSPGDDPGVFEFMGHRIAVLICYDVEFPEFVREAAAAGAEIVLTPTALKSEWAFVARKMIPTRAFENGVFLLYVNHSGREGGSEYLGESVIAGPDGRKLAVAGSGEAILSAELDISNVSQARRTLPYLNVVAQRGWA